MATQGLSEEQFIMGLGVRPKIIVTKLLNNPKKKKITYENLLK